MVIASLLSSLVLFCTPRWPALLFNLSTFFFFSSFFPVADGRSNAINTQRDRQPSSQGRATLFPSFPEQSGGGRVFSHPHSTCWPEERRCRDVFRSSEPYSHATSADAMPQIALSYPWCEEFLLGWCSCAWTLQALPLLCVDIYFLWCFLLKEVERSWNCDMSYASYHAQVGRYIVCVHGHDQQL